jgi:sporulation protein YlmC with PRC-barrel domain
MNSTDSEEVRWVVLDLLDRQIIDNAQQPVGKVDDLQFETDDAGPPRLSALLSGAQALGERMGGMLGRAMAGTARRMLEESRVGSRAVPWSDVAELGYVIELRAGMAKLDLEPALELWLRDNVIGPMPGSGHARG